MTDEERAIHEADLKIREQQVELLKAQTRKENAVALEIELRNKNFT
jgi:hypothetical protein